MNDEKNQDQQEPQLSPEEIEVKHVHEALSAALDRLKAKRADLLAKYAAALIQQGQVTQHADDFLDAIERTDRHVAAMEALLK